MATVRHQEPPHVLEEGEGAHGADEGPVLGSDHHGVQSPAEDCRIRRGPGARPSTSTRAPRLVIRPFIHTPRLVIRPFIHAPRLVICPFFIR